MKKTLIISVLAFAFSALPAYAATLDLSPQTVTVAPGQTVSVVVSVNPAGATLSAIKSEISYPTNLLTPTSFTFASTWVPVTLSGYDQMAGGTIIKSAGYPGGVASPTAFGTIVFTAQAAGTATIAVQSSSVAYDTTGNSKLTGAQGTSVVTIQSVSVTEPAVVAATSSASTTQSTVTQNAIPTTQSAPQAPTRKPGTSVVAKAPAAIATAAASGTEASSTSTSTLAAVGLAQTAAVANAPVSGGLGSFWIWAVLILAVLATGSWLYARRK